MRLRQKSIRFFYLIIYFLILRPVWLKIKKTFLFRRINLYLFSTNLQNCKNYTTPFRPIPFCLAYKFEKSHMTTINHYVSIISSWKNIFKNMTNSMEIKLIGDKIWKEGLLLCFEIFQILH